MKNNHSYQNALIYYFSGGGNALRAGKWIAAKLTGKGVNASIIPFNRIKEIGLCENKNSKSLNPPLSPFQKGENLTLPLEKGGRGDFKPSFANSDSTPKLEKPTKRFNDRTLIGFVFPTHGFIIVWSMLKAILSFPKSHGKEDAFIISTVGGTKLFSLFIPGFPGSSLLIPQIILIAKGYRVMGTLALNMPVHWAALFPPMGKKTNASIVNHCKGVVERFTEKILNGQRTYYPWWLLPIIIALIPISLLYLFIGRFFLPKLYFFTTKCNGCGICQSKCPVKAIKMMGNRPYWTFRCESCQRCINFCPNKAIQASLPYLILVMLAYSSIFDRWIGQKLDSILTVSLGDFSGIISFIIWNVLCALFLYVTYPLLLMLLRIRFLNVILTYTSITRYYGRYREPGTNIQDFED